MRIVEAVHVLGMIREECKKEHLDTEAEACDLAIKILKYWGMNRAYIHDLEFVADSQDAVQ